MAQTPGERDELSNQPNSSRLGFDTFESFDNLVPSGFEKCPNGSASSCVDAISERYIRGEIYLVFKLRSDRTDGEYDLIFASVNRLKELKLRAGREAGALELKVCCPGAADKQSMFGLSANPVKCPNGMAAPSFVWLDAAQERMDIRWEGFPVGIPPVG